MKFNLAAQIPGEIAQWKQMPYLTRKCRSGKNFQLVNLKQLVFLIKYKLFSLYFLSFPTFLAENTTRGKNTRENRWGADVFEQLKIDQSKN